jgi:DNA-directed RNA polymerase specialized sigma24 family protein
LEFSPAVGDECGYHNVLLSEIRKRVTSQAWRVIAAHYMSGYTLVEIARDEGMRLKQVQKIRDRTLEMLREVLSEENSKLLKKRDHA